LDRRLGGPQNRWVVLVLALKQLFIKTTFSRNEREQGRKIRKRVKKMEKKAGVVQVGEGTHN
jgi:hypothetical protein